MTAFELGESMGQLLVLLCCIGVPALAVVTPFVVWLVRQQRPRKSPREESIEWARAVLAEPTRHVVLDTETTGLSSYDEVVQIACIDAAGNVIVDTLVKPRGSISEDATRIHGIRNEDVADAPSWGDVSTQLQSLLADRTVITYNAEFDLRMIRQTTMFHGLGFVPSGKWTCAMLAYAQYVGEVDRNKSSYKWHKLRGGDHTAVGDCRAALALIQRMANGE